LFREKTIDDNFLQKKNKIFFQMKKKLSKLYPSETWTSWIDSINLAWLAGFSLYNDYVPFFELIFYQFNSNWKKFFIYIKMIGKKKKEDRDFLIKNILKKE
jgi:predicted aminopeptidase